MNDAAGRRAAAHAASTELPDNPPATTTTVALPAAPTGEFDLGINVAGRQFVVIWEPVPAPFDYTWAVYNTSGGGKTLLASGTASTSSSETIVYTWPIGSTSLRLEVTSDTDPAVSDFTEYEA
ncbi:MAG: hypothetical protein ACKO27_10210 [Ilumatobacteraceae bacterium]